LPEIEIFPVGIFICSYRPPCSHFVLTRGDAGFTLFNMDKEQIKAKLAEAVKSNPYVDDIKSVAIFGSYAAGEATDASDVDVLIDFVPKAVVGFFKYVRIQRYLGEVLGLNVDLVTPQALSKYIKPQVLQDAEIVYEK